jgi:hypothetical protein
MAGTHTRLIVPSGTTAERLVVFPNPEVGALYFNTTLNDLEVYNGTSWPSADMTTTTSTTTSTSSSTSTTTSTTTSTSTTTTSTTTSL